MHFKPLHNHCDAYSHFCRVRCSSSDKTVKVWDAATRQCVHTFHDHLDQVCLTNNITPTQSLLIISPVTRRAATWPLVLELIFFLSNNVRMSKANEMGLRDHNSNNCTHSGNVCYCTYMVNNDYDKFRSFSRLYMTLFRHRTCTYLHGRVDRFLVSVFNGQVAALSDWAYYQ